MTYLSITEAIQAYIEKQEVEYSSKWDPSWLTLTSSNHIELLDAPNLKFRLKPIRVTISYETPMPFTPKEGENYWCIEPRSVNGYLSSYYCTNNPIHNLRVMTGVYRTEQDVAVALANQQYAIANIL